MRRIRITLGVAGGGAALVVALLVAQLALAGAVASGQPLSVASTSLRQEGQQLVWTLALSQPFSPGALARDGRRVCLLLERPAGGSETGQLCLAGPRGATRAPRLLFSPVIAGAAHRGRSIPATITRSSSRALTASFLPDSIGQAYRPLAWQVLSAVASPGCPPAAGQTLPGGCRALFPATPARLRLHTPRLVGCQATGPDWVHSGSPNGREIALTFDDGPAGEPPASAFVDLLARRHVPATFFEIGDQIGEYDPDGRIERQMLADGDMIGDHTWSHPDMDRLSAAAQRSQLEQAAAAIERATGFRPCLFRSPYGDVDPELLGLARSLGFTTIQWDVDPRDWALPGVAAIEQNVIAHAHDGAIVIQHFGGGPRYQTLAALPDEISALRARGYRFVTVTQMLGYRLIYR